jgi:cystathionine beta-lyase/cystathionine gamma-synthase
MTHSAMNPDELQAAGISQRCIRLSLGIEDPNDIIADLSKALEAI